MLSAESSAEPGKWDTARAEYQREPMDAASEPLVDIIVLMFASQTGKTSIEENIVGFHIDQDPSPVLFLMPTLDMAQAFSKDRLAPMVRDTPALQGKIGDARARDSDNTLLHKGFPGGHITMAGANSPASLASRPIRLLLCDEIDRYPPSAGTEGDPVSLAQKRTTAFWNKKIVLSATPTVKGASRIEVAYEESDQRRFWVPCPHCGHDQTLRWPQVRWPADHPEEAKYCCEACGTLWSDIERWRAVSKGVWRAAKPFNGTAGFHLNEIYSPWIELADMVKAFLEAKAHPERLKVWVNTALAETWEEDAERMDAGSLQERTEDWGDPLPPDILMLTAGIDLQIDRAEVEVVGWGVGEESWSVEHRILYGDPSGPELWKELSAYLESRFEVEGKGELAITAACIDSGYQTQAVYQWARDKFRRRFYPVKGIAGAGRPVWPKRASKNVKGGVNLFLVGVDAAKDMIYARLKLKAPGPGYCHFPKDRDAEYFRQLTAERVHTRHVKGFAVRVYEKDPSIRAEALDCRVYAYAALVSLNVNWGGLQKHFEPKPDPVATMPPPRLPDEPIPQPPPSAGVSRSGRRVIRSGFMSR